MLARIRTNPAPQSRHRVLLFMERRVIPALDGRNAILDPLAAQRMAPLLDGQFLETDLKFARWRWSGQQRTDHAETEAGPLFMGRTAGRILRHRIVLSLV
jgi:hypothetical protein